MTTRRLIASLTASGAALALAATVAVRSFPLEAQGQAPARRLNRRGGEPIQIVKGAEHLLHAATARVPAPRHRAEASKATCCSTSPSTTAAKSPMRAC